MSFLKNRSSKVIEIKYIRSVGHCCRLLCATLFVYRHFFWGDGQEEKPVGIAGEKSQVRCDVGCCQSVPLSQRDPSHVIGFVLARKTYFMTRPRPCSPRLFWPPFFLMRRIGLALLLWNRVFDNSLFSSALSGKSSCQQFIQHPYLSISIFNNNGTRHPL